MLVSRTSPPILAALAALVLTLAPASALVLRAGVSGKGVDVATCGAPSAPCRSFQYVHDHIIAPGGEILVLDSAGYGPVTIAKALSIVNDGAGVAGVAQSVAGLSAITINAGANDAVSLRGLTIDGFGSGFRGIVLASGGLLTIANCVVRGFTGDGIVLGPPTASTVTIANTISSQNHDAGVYIAPSGGAHLTGLTTSDNQWGVYAQGVGVSASVLNSTASRNALDGYYAILNASLELRDVVVMGNAQCGILADSFGAIFLSRSYVSGNGAPNTSCTGANGANGGVVFTAGDNTFLTDGSNMTTNPFAFSVR
jgi:hypothetical protein